MLRRGEGGGEGGHELRLLAFGGMGQNGKTKAENLYLQ